MLQAIGLLVSAYVFLRSLETIARAPSIEHAGNRRIVIAVSVCVLLIAVACSYELLSSGARLAGEARRLGIPLD